MKLTNAQNRQIELLSDGKAHNLYNHGIKGLNQNSLDALVSKGIVTKEIVKDPSREKEVFGEKYSFHPDRDIFFKLA